MANPADGMLESVVNIAEHSEDLERNGLGISVVLVVGGMVVRGTLISSQAYYRRIQRPFDPPTEAPAGAAPKDDTEAALVASLKKIGEYIASNPPPATVEFIHLENVVYGAEGRRFGSGRVNAWRAPL